VATQFTAGVATQFTAGVATQLTAGGQLNLQQGWQLKWILTTETAGKKMTIANGKIMFCNVCE
jgi:nitrogen fixation protein